MNIADLYGLLPLITLIVFCIGAELIGSTDIPHVIRATDVAGIGLMIISMGIGIAMVVIYAGPTITENFDTLSCLRNHSINHCALSKLS